MCSKEQGFYQSNGVVRKITIWVRGDDEHAAKGAFDEAIIRIQAGNVTGNDVSMDAAFYFRSTTDVPAEEIPYMGWPKEED